MPWYRVPFDLHERAARYVDDPTAGLTPAQKAVLDVVKTSEQMPPLFAGNVVHLNFGRRGRAPRACAVCGWISERLCDWKMPDGRDCDRPLCSSCTTSPATDKDLCPEHVQRFKAWLAGRTNSVDGTGP